TATASGSSSTATAPRPWPASPASSAPSAPSTEPAQPRGSDRGSPLAGRLLSIVLMPVGRVRSSLGRSERGVAGKNFTVVVAWGTPVRYDVVILSRPEDNRGLRFPNR